MVDHGVVGEDHIVDAIEAVTSLLVFLDIPRREVGRVPGDLDKSGVDGAFARRALPRGAIPHTHPRANGYGFGDDGEKPAEQGIAGEQAVRVARCLDGIERARDPRASVAVELAPLERLA